MAAFRRQQHRGVRGLQRRGLTRRLAAYFTDHRDPHSCEHSLQRLLSQCRFGLALGDADVHDRHPLRDESLLVLPVGSDDLSGAHRLRARDRNHPLAASRTLNRRKLGTPEKTP